MTQRGILVTGGAGYIGSHVVKQLGKRGEKLVVLDNLSTGFRDAVLYGEFIQGDTGDAVLVERILRDYAIESVLHFAAHTIVPESVENPLKYYGNNTCNTQNLLRGCQNAGVSHFIFSSTAAAYGIPSSAFCSEDTAVAPINPYGTSKLMSEMMLRDLSAASSLRHVILRYFNVAGSDPDGEIGQSTAKATLLIKVAAEVAVGKREKLLMFGTDYPTPDGTGVRDYIHVVDLAIGHVKALERPGDSGLLAVNLGTGQGYSVLDMVRAFEKASGRKVPYKIVARRPGDIGSVYADPALALKVLGWEAARGIDEMCRDGWKWQSGNPEGYATGRR